LAGETEILGEILPPCPVVPPKTPHALPGREPGPTARETSDKRVQLRHGSSNGILYVQSELITDSFKKFAS
jgi:hypothetical protein